MLFEKNPYIFNEPMFARSHAWKFIGGIKQPHESFEQTVVRKVKGIANIKLGPVEVLSHIGSMNETTYFYHARLTDDQVNNMERGEGHLLQFFSFKELESLPLSDTTRLLISQNREFMERINAKTSFSSLM